MKKLYIIIALTLWGFAQTAGAQNMYRYYQPFFHSKNAISVVHSNGYIYFFQTDLTGTLLATQIAPITMMPLYTSNLSQNLPNVYLKGAFEDHNGDIVLFGCDNSGWNPLYIVVDQNLANYSVFESLSSGQFVAGCEGYSQNGSPIYMMVTNTGKLYAIDYNYQYTPSIIYPPYTFAIFELPRQYSFDIYTDISWDTSLNQFIATGVISNGLDHWLDPFVEVFKYDLANNTIISQPTYLIDNNAYNDVSVAQALHAKLNNNELLLYQDLRHHDTQYFYDNIWLTRIKYYWDASMAFPEESFFYELPSTKIFAKDMIYDSHNKRLSLLGEFINCEYLQILAQVNPFQLYSGINIGQLGIGFSISNTCTNLQPPTILLYSNDIVMSNLALNHYNPCVPLLVAGVKDPNGILSETYDIASSSCDELLWHHDSKAIPILKPCTLNHSMSADLINPISSNTTLDNVSNGKICADNNSCFHKNDDKVLEQSLSNCKPAVDIYLEGNNHFICEGFEGEIQYSIYDVEGKLMQQGTTNNGMHNPLTVANGIFFSKFLILLVTEL